MKILVFLLLCEGGDDNDNDAVTSVPRFFFGCPCEEEWGMGVEREQGLMERVELHRARWPLA